MACAYNLSINRKMHECGEAYAAYGKKLAEGYLQYKNKSLYS